MFWAKNIGNNFTFSWSLTADSPPVQRGFLGIDTWSKYEKKGESTCCEWKKILLGFSFPFHPPNEVLKWSCFSQRKEKEVVTTLLGMETGWEFILQDVKCDAIKFDLNEVVCGFKETLFSNFGWRMSHIYYIGVSLNPLRVFRCQTCATLMFLDGNKISDTLPAGKQSG